MHRYIDVLKKYALFEGRARRKDYWAFVLINMGLGVCVSLVALAFAPRRVDLIRMAFDLVVFLPTVSVTIRRMHDVDRKGWWCLVPFVGLLYAVREGTHGPNRFGEDVKAIEDADRNARSSGQR